MQFFGDRLGRVLITDLEVRPQKACEQQVRRIPPVGGCGGCE